MTGRFSQAKPQALQNHPFLEHLQQQFPVNQWRNHRVVVAVSGGADSVALLRGLHQLAAAESQHAGQQLIVAHVNHQQRGEAADQDANFVEALAGQLDLPFHLLVPKNVPKSLEGGSPSDLGSHSGSLGNEKQREYATDSKAGASEEQLRTIRYQALQNLAGSLGARYLVLGHHRDDQVETILFRIFRGTGVAGLTGIPASRVVDDALTVVRPLLDLPQQQLSQFLAKVGQAYRHDESNDDARFMRNFLRHEVLPMLNRRFAGSVESAIVRLASQAAECQAIVDQQVERLLQQIDFVDETMVHVNRKLLSTEPDYLLQSMFVKIWKYQHWPRQPMDENAWKRLAKAIGESGNICGRFYLPGRILCTTEDDKLTLKCELAVDSSDVRN